MFDRICFHTAGTLGIHCAFSCPKTLFNIFVNTCSFRVYLLFEQIDAGNIVTDIGILHFIDESILSSRCQYPRCSRMIFHWKNCNFESMNSNNTYDSHLNDWSHFCPVWNFAMTSGSRITSGKCIFFTLSFDSSLPFDKLGFVMKKSFGFTVLHDSTSQSMEYWLCTGRSSKIFRFPLRFPEALSSLGIDTKDFTSSASPLFIDDLLKYSSEPTHSLILHLLSNRIDNTNSQLLWFAENMILNKSSEFVDSALKCMEYFP